MLAEEANNEADEEMGEPAAAAVGSTCDNQPDEDMEEPAPTTDGSTSWFGLPSEAAIVQQFPDCLRQGSQ